MRVDKFVLSRGGGNSSQGRFAVTGTIRQKEGDRRIANGRFSLRPGFWNVIGLIQLPGSPELRILQSAGTVWRPSTGAVAVVDGRIQKEIRPHPGNLFFRLRQQ